MKMLDVDGQPRRPFHKVPPSPQKVRQYEAWKKRYEKERERGHQEGWLEYSYEDEDYVPGGPQPTIVYDESKESFDARVKAWNDAMREANEQRHVAFPVHTRPHLPPEGMGKFS